MSAEVTDWHEYFRNIRLAREEAERLADESDDVLVVVEPSRPATPADLNASLNGTIASLTLCGFWSASQVTVALLPGKAFKTGPRAGESRPDKFLTNVFIHAAHPDRRTAKIWYQDGSLQSATIGVAHGAVRVVNRNMDVDAFIEGREI
jgi:hypothetical protein